MVDDEDYEFLVNCYNFNMNGVYVECRVKNKYKNMGLYTKLQLQKLLKQPEKLGRNVVVDHRDGNELNNQKENLRVCTHAENMRNRKVSEGTSSIYKGVYWYEQLKCWRADLRYGKGNRLYIGLFDSEISAANAYNHYIKIYHKEFASLNEVPFLNEQEWESHRIVKPNTSRYRGVSLVENEWLVQIMHKGIQYRVGSFENEIDAAKAYNEKAIELKGNNARLNAIRLSY